jgi:RNA polymerase sigma-70 factor (ECF subfamily)
VNAPSLWAVLEVLPNAQREVLRLRVVAGLSAEQAATLLGCTPEAVRLTQHRALDALRDELTARGTSSPDV